MYFVLGILLGTDLVSVFALVSLWALNRSVADLSKSSDVALSQRYQASFRDARDFRKRRYLVQVTENIRTIRVMLPVTGCGTLVNIAGNVVVAIQAAFFRNTFREAPVFFMVSYKGEELVRLC